MTSKYFDIDFVQPIVDRVFKTTLASGLSYVPSTGLSKHDRTKETQVALG